MTAQTHPGPVKPPADQHVKPQADHAEHAKTLVQRIADLRAWLFLAALILVFEIWARTSFGGTFILNPFNLQSIAIFAVAPLLLATGQTFVIISGGIDLSMGFIMGLAAVVAAHVINATSPVVGLAGGVFLGFAGGVLIACIPGIVNGLLISQLKVPPFIGTLGMFGVARGVAFLLAGEPRCPCIIRSSPSSATGASSAFPISC